MLSNRGISFLKKMGWFVFSLASALVVLTTCGKVAPIAPFSVGAVGADGLALSPSLVSLGPNGSQQFTVSGGAGPYNYALSTSTLGSITSGGLFSGVPWSTGDVIIKVTDANSSLATATVQVVPTALTLAASNSSITWLNMVQDSSGNYYST